jgi:hypothetical protein
MVQAVKATGWQAKARGAYALLRARTGRVHAHELTYYWRAH